jgi:WD40 repeat protein
LWRDGAGLTPLGTPQVASTSAPGSSNQVEFVAFRRDATVLATGADDGTVRLWDVSHPAQPRWLATIPDVTNQYVYSVTFSPGGQILAGGVTDGSVWLWRVSRPSHPTPIATLTGPAGHVFSIAFGPGGRTLTAGSSDGSVWRWDTAPGQAAAGICAMAGQPLTRAQWHTYFPGRPYSPPCPRG